MTKLWVTLFNQESKRLKQMLSGKTGRAKNTPTLCKKWLCVSFIICLCSDDEYIDEYPDYQYEYDVDYEDYNTMMLGYANDDTTDYAMGNDFSIRVQLYF